MIKNCKCGEKKDYKVLLANFVRVGITTQFKEGAKMGERKTYLGNCKNIS